MLGNYCRFSFELFLPSLSGSGSSNFISPLHCCSFEIHYTIRFSKIEEGYSSRRLASPFRRSTGGSPRSRSYFSFPSFATRFSRGSSSPGTRFLEDSFHRVNLFFLRRVVLFRRRRRLWRETLCRVWKRCFASLERGAVSTFAFALSSTLFRHFVSALPFRCRPRLRSGGGLLQRSPRAVNSLVYDFAIARKFADRSPRQSAARALSHRMKRTRVR